MESYDRHFRNSDFYITRARAARHTHVAAFSAVIALKSLPDIMHYALIHLQRFQNGMRLRAKLVVDATCRRIAVMRMTSGWNY